MDRAIPFEVAQEHLEAAAGSIFRLDPRVRSVGVSRHGAGFGYHAVRNGAMVLPAGGFIDEKESVEDLPVRYTDAPGDPKSLVLAPGGGLVSPMATSLVPEVQRHRPLACGLQIQNFDDDHRKEHLAKGLIYIATLGGFITTADGAPGMLSNNHVVAGENSGVRGSDRILQPGSLAFDPSDRIAVLSEFAALVTSPVGDTFENGRASLNEVDAAVAILDPDMAFRQAFLPFRKLPAPAGIAQAKVGDQVFKVGRTTGLTWGEVTDLSTIVGPIPYAPGLCWFRRSLTIEGAKGTLFSDHGDSGSLILRSNGEVVGLLYAGNGQQTYASPIREVLDSLQATLV